MDDLFDLSSFIQNDDALTLDFGEIDNILREEDVDILRSAVTHPPPRQLQAPVVLPRPPPPQVITNNGPPPVINPGPGFPPNISSNVPAPGRHFRQPPVFVNHRYTVNISSDKVMNTVRNIGSFRGPSQSSDTPQGHDNDAPKAEYVKLLRALTTTKNTIIRLFADHPELKTSKTASVKELKTLTTGSILESATLLEETRAAKRPTKINLSNDDFSPQDNVILELNLGGGTADDKLLRALQKIKELWNYEHRHWQHYFLNLSDMTANTTKEFIHSQKSALRDGFKTTESLISQIVTALENPATVDMPLLVTYVNELMSLFKTELSIVTQKLIEGEILKTHNEELRKERVTHLQIISELRKKLASTRHGLHS